ncbi:alpha/beta fold hydrolase [Ramlibacter humi]|uniref:Alpha/beta fold hydrolase n=1 Tax=Ramlibacter humi TaxID=2530451 RepID=A0A4Z0CAS9_9BURK|nr:alpha/beta fold hydrolase [Ramlibacter humi]TFZ08114.1 alpha/beta fold hydrolase [Ramlibacter humi]
MPQPSDDPVSAPRRSLTLALLSLFARPGAATPRPPAANAGEIGIVLLHGIGATGESMAPLAAKLRAQGWQVVTPDMPYGGPRAFSQPVAEAERIALDAVEQLRKNGAKRIVLAGFSLGGFFAAHLASRTRADALVAIAPNGGADMKKLDDQLRQAHALIAQGAGNQPAKLQDGAVVGNDRYDLAAATPSAYVTWFDPQGAMNWKAVWSQVPAGLPVLLVVPRRDLENLRRVKDELWAGLPPDPQHRLYEPRTDHLGAPMASADEMVRWLRETVEAPPNR